MNEAHTWSRELVGKWAAETNDVEWLQACFDACRSRLAQLQAPRRGIPLVEGANVWANGQSYVVDKVQVRHAKRTELLPVWADRREGAPIPPPQNVEIVNLELSRPLP